MSSNLITHVIAAQMTGEHIIRKVIQDRLHKSQGNERYSNGLAWPPVAFRYIFRFNNQSCISKGGAMSSTFTRICGSLVKAPVTRNAIAACIDGVACCSSRNFPRSRPYKSMFDTGCSAPDSPSSASSGMCPSSECVGSRGSIEGAPNQPQTIVFSLFNRDTHTVGSRGRLPTKLVASS
ncbi:unnamed protein product [Phytophthora fragariaefolia]|uniref:Unnamed protein product n=1 Tax=Phytophthora fragariaefolia TaxID=1490495 RepID=A0A9W6XKK4_9STRA|nr:unnamed protein product [Phytophthora fragariaefolia]